jgi:multiple sugar transport system ATP-binding protein
MIAGLENVSRGDVFIDDEQVTDWAPKARDIAMVFQNYALYPHMTVRQNMGFALKLRHMDKDEARQKVEETAGLLGLAALIDRKPAALSGGQRQRVAMGRAMVRQPRVFLLDEPLSNLDAKLRVCMRAELARLHQRYRITTVYVTHDQVEAMTLGDRIAVIDKGRLQQVGTPEELYRSPVNRFVAGFMGSPSMNFATVELGGVPDRVTLRLGGQEFEVPGAVHRRPSLARYLGAPVVVGLRPAAFSLAESPGTATLAIVPLGAESLGDEKHLLFEAPTPGSSTTRVAADDVPLTVDESSGTQLWTAKVTQHADLTIGHPVPLAVDLRDAYFFDPVSGDAVAEVHDSVPAVQRELQAWTA